MNSIEIENHLKNMNCFSGVYPIDLISNLKFIKRPVAIVINLDSSDKPGSHWVAIFINDDNIAYYFDSFGSQINKKEILEFLMRNKVKNLLYNKYLLQSFDSSVCGAYCILFIKMMCSHFEFSEFIKLFSNNSNNNDLISSLILE